MSTFYDTVDLGWSFASNRRFGAQMMDASAGSEFFDSVGRFGVYIDDHPGTVSDQDFPGEWSSNALANVFLSEPDIDVATHEDLFASDGLRLIDAFDLIFSVWPKQNPTWWRRVATNLNWRGRVVFIGEWTFGGMGGVDIAIWIRDVASPIIGMKMWGSSQGVGCPDFAPMAAGAFARFAVLPTLHFANTNWINHLVDARPIYEVRGSHAGGPMQTLPMMSETVRSSVNWILSGDSNAFYDDVEFGCVGLVEENASIFRSFTTVPIGPETSSTVEISVSDEAGAAIVEDLSRERVPVWRPTGVLLGGAP